jgi:BASS family bile acid:Na+ symporter
MIEAQIDQLRIVLDPIGQSAVAGALFLIVFGVSLGLKASDFRFLRQRPLVFFGGVAAQVIGLPLATFLIVLALGPPASIALGMIVVACCPGGSSSNLLTFLARGDVAYSVSLTATSSLVAALLTPLSIIFWSDLYPPTATLLDTLDFRPLAFLIQTATLLALPLIAGMSIARLAPGLAARARRPVTLAGAFILGAVILYGAAHLLPVLGGAIALIGPIAVVHNAAAFAVGAVAGRLMRAEKAIRRALVFEVGIQNSGLAIVILLGQLKGLGGAAAIAAVWGIWHLVAGGVIVLIFRMIDRRSVAP